MLMNSAADWSEFKLNKQLLDAVADAGFTWPTEIQEKCLPLIAAGQQVIGIAQTGTGKTAAYLLPLLLKLRYAQGTDIRALILVPTKELVVQVAEHARALAKYTDLRVVEIYGGVGPKTQIEKIQAGLDLLIATPGRFMEIYQRDELPVKQIKVLVLDEADKMMDMGFMPQLRKIFEVIPPKRQNVLFSATFPQKVERLAAEFLDFPVRIEITPQATVAVKVEQELYHVPNALTKINFLEYLLADKDTFTRVMIFTRTKEVADNVFRFLERKKLGPARVVHSNKGQNSRINAMNEFKEGKLRILVSTDVASRGIDVTNVSHVINFDVPIMYEDYVHRTGRTGRALREGKAITLVTDAETYHIDKIEKIIREKIPVKKLPKQVEIAETPFEEAQAMAREIDRQKRYEDPEFKGAFHLKKWELKR
ncbi:MAG: DEAD/DEAH box helicase [Cyclobacteriaceae bacterium]|nr:DEAD/DEAH box helicase [Cyclobacteriaceae bacterium]